MFGLFLPSYFRRHAFVSQASFTMARILFPQCPAIWRAMSCPFSDTKSVKTARLRIVCAMSCHVVPSVKLFTKCVTLGVTHVYFSVVVTSRHLGIFLNISKFSPRHGTHYFAWPASPRIPTHALMGYSIICTSNCVPWRKPFVMPVWSASEIFIIMRYINPHCCWRPELVQVPCVTTVFVAMLQQVASYYIAYYTKLIIYNTIWIASYALVVYSSYWRETHNICAFTINVFSRFFNQHITIYWYVFITFGSQ